MDNWKHFTFTSGSNPYIAKTKSEAARILTRWKDAGAKITEQEPGFYLIDDKACRNEAGFIL